MLAFVLPASACGFEELERQEPPTGGFDDLEGAVTIGGVQVLPAVIMPGDRVTMRDPTTPAPGQPAPVYVWTACDGVVEGADYGREITWVAPPEAGLHAISVNVVNSRGDAPSRVVTLCVVDGEGDSCPPAAATSPILESLVARPESFVQATECQQACEAALEAVVATSDGEPPRYLWAARGGSVIGDGASALWRLPSVGCCPETFAAALTVCGPGGTAGTGQIHVAVAPD